MKKTVQTFRKWSAILMIAVMLLASLSGCAPQEKELKIGYVTEQTGVEAYIGQASIPALQDHVDKINAEGGDVFTLLSELGQSDVRVTRALLGMAGAGDMLSQSLADSADAYANGTDALDEYEKRSQTAAAQVQVAWNGANCWPNVMFNLVNRHGDAGASWSPSEDLIAFSELGGPAISLITPAPVCRNASTLPRWKLPT